MNFNFKRPYVTPKQKKLPNIKGFNLPVTIECFPSTFVSLNFRNIG